MVFPFTAAPFDSVRRAIDVALDATTLPDVVIGDDVYLGAAVSWAVIIYPAAAFETDAAKQALIGRAINLKTASYLAPHIPQMLAETWPGYTYQQQSRDWLKLAGELSARADEAMAAVLETPRRGSARPTMFAVASGTRGR
jgi:hypothetical protein